MQNVNAFANESGLPLNMQKGISQEHAGLDAWQDDATTDHGTSSGDEKSLASCDWSPVSNVSTGQESFLSRESRIGSNVSTGQESLLSRDSLLSSCDWSPQASPLSMGHENFATADPLVPSPSSGGSRRSALREAGMEVLASLNKGPASFERPKAAQRAKQEVHPTCHQQQVDVAAQALCGQFTEYFTYLAQAEDLSQALCGQFPEYFNTDQQLWQSLETSKQVEPMTVDFSPEPCVLVNFIKERSANMEAKDMPLKVQSEVCDANKQALQPQIAVDFETPARIQSGIPEVAPGASELDPRFPFKICLSEFLLEEQPSGGFH